MGERILDQSKNKYRNQSKGKRGTAKKTTMFISGKSADLHKKRGDNSCKRIVTGKHIHDGNHVSFSTMLSPDTAPSPRFRAACPSVARPMPLSPPISLEEPILFLCCKQKNSATLRQQAQSVFPVEERRYIKKKKK